MSRIQSRYRKHLSIYTNHHDLDARLKNTDRSRSIIAFLRVGLVFLIVGIIASGIGALMITYNKTSIADWLSSYASGIIAQLPAGMTGEIIVSSGTMRLHVNNDTAFVINLTKDIDEKMDDGHTNDIWLTVLVDTSLSTMPTNTEHAVVVIQNAILIHNDEQSRVYDFDTMSAWDTSHDESIAITQEMIQTWPAQIQTLVYTHISTLAWIVAVVAMVASIVLWSILLITIALRYFFLCFIIRCLVSIVVAIAKREIPHNKRDIICILGFGPFLLHLFLLSSPLYVLAMTLFICFLIYQHRDFHQKK